MTSGSVQVRLPRISREEKIRASGAASLEAAYQVQTRDPSGSSAKDPPWLQGSCPETLMKQPSNCELAGSAWIERESSSNAQKRTCFFAEASGASSTPRKKIIPIKVATGMKPARSDRTDPAGRNSVAHDLVPGRGKGVVGMSMFGGRDRIRHA